jgi:hypothetical protein
MCMSKLRRLHVIEDALFHKACVENIRALTDRYPNPSATRLEEAEAAPMPPFPQAYVLVRYQTTLDRQLANPRRLEFRLVRGLGAGQGCLQSAGDRSEVRLGKPSRFNNLKRRHSYAGNVSTVEFENQCFSRL